MALEDQVVALLKADESVAALVGARIFVNPAPQGTASPFITYQIVGNLSIGMTYAARAAHDVMTLQVDCWADHTTITSAQSRYDKVVDLARAVRSALNRKGLVGEDEVDLILWTDWRDLNTPDETRRSLDFDIYVKDPNMTAGIYWFDADGNNIEIAFSATLTGSPLVFTDIPEAKAAGRNAEASPEIDFTNYDSVEQELKLGLARRGSYDVTANFVPTSAVQEEVMDFNETKEERIWRIRYPKTVLTNGSRAEERFRGYVQVASINPPGATDQTPVEFSFTLRVAGAYVYEKEAA